MIEYLTSWLFLVGLMNGAIALELLWRLTGGRWGASLRPALLSIARTAPVLAFGYLPVALRLTDLYPWADADLVAHDPVLQHRSVWMNPLAFHGRTLLAFLVWSGLAWALGRRGRQVKAGPWLVLHVGLVTVAAFDWIMSLEKHFYSTNLGAISLMSGATGALALSILLSPADDRKARNDRGNLLLAFVMLEAYLAFSQLVIVWSANLPHEIHHYESRVFGAWGVIAALLMVGLFALPFLLLIFPENRHQRLSRVAAIVLVMGWVYQAWMVLPSVYSKHLVMGPTNLLWLAVLGGPFLLLVRWGRNPEKERTL